MYSGRSPEPNKLQRSFSRVGTKGASTSIDLIGLHCGTAVSNVVLKSSGSIAGTLCEAFGLTQFLYMQNS